MKVENLFLAAMPFVLQLSVPRRKRKEKRKKSERKRKRREREKERMKRKKRKKRKKREKEKRKKLDGVSKLGAVQVDCSSFRSIYFLIN